MPSLRTIEPGAQCDFCLRPARFFIDLDDLTTLYCSAHRADGSEPLSGCPGHAGRRGGYCDGRCLHESCKEPDGLGDCPNVKFHTRTKKVE